MSLGRAADQQVGAAKMRPSMSAKRWRMSPSTLSAPAGLLVVSMVLLASPRALPLAPAEARSLALTDFEMATVANEPRQPAGLAFNKQLNESLRALERLVGEASPANLTARAWAGARGERADSLDELAELDEDVELATGDEQEEEAAARLGGGGSGAADGGQRRKSAAVIRTALVRQLSDLMMNHAHPATIARTIGSAREPPGGAGEARQARRGRELLDGGQEAVRPPEEPPAGSGENFSATAAEGQDDLAGLQQLQQGEQAITCSPDYEDQAMDAAAAAGAMSEAFNGPGGTANGSLTAELPVGQPLAGDQLANESGLLLASQTSQRALQMQQQQQQQQQNTLIGQCVPAGSRMIEVITKIITPILFSIIIVVGLVGNIIVMLVILEDRKLERELTPTNLLILDLSLADLSFIIFCIPFTGWDYAVGHWVFGSLWCKLNQYLIVVCALSSIYTLVLMSCDRFMAIVYPIECINYRTSRNMLHAIVIKWIVILLVASPTMLVHGLIDSPLGPDQYNCRFLSDQHNPLHFQIIFFFTSYLFPLILIFGLYLSLLNKLWFGQKPLGHKESHKMLESKKKVTWLVASIVIVFAACWCPIQIMLILMRLKSHKITATYVAVQVFAHTLGYMNSCVNPIVYAFASETFNQSFKKSWLARLFFCCCCCCPETAGGGGAGSGSGHTNNNNNNNNNSHYYNNPTNGLTGATNASHGGSFAQRRESRTFPDRLAARNSLQVSPGVSNGGNQQQQPRNQSAGHIFAQHQGGHLHAAPRKPPLEPRDRPQAITPPPPPPAAIIHTQSPTPPPPATSASANNKTTEADAPAAQVAGGAEASPQAAGGAKQQLVARVVGPAGGNCNPVVAHQCKPCEADY